VGMPAAGLLNAATLMFQHESRGSGRTIRDRRIDPDAPPSKVVDDQTLLPVGAPFLAWAPCYSRPQHRRTGTPERRRRGEATYAHNCHGRAAELGRIAAAPSTRRWSGAADVGRPSRAERTCIADLERGARTRP
jgi:hypothetical protein